MPTLREKLEIAAGTSLTLFMLSAPGMRADSPPTGRHFSETDTLNRSRIALEIDPSPTPEPIARDGDLVNSLTSGLDQGIGERGQWTDFPEDKDPRGDGDNPNQNQGGENLPAPDDGSWEHLGFD